MKVNELREKLSKLKKEEIVKIASEFYKLIPKSKKEDYDLDSYIDDPSKRQKKSKSTNKISLQQLEIDLEEFIEDAKNQYYLFSNRKVPKKERSKWRFKVKRWYKELTNRKREDVDINKQSVLLKKQYELLCESCGYQYFSGYDSFQSVGVDQTVFYRSVIDLLQESQGKRDSLKECIELIVNNFLNRYTLYANLMTELIETLENVDLKYQGIDICENFIKSIQIEPVKSKRPYQSSSTEEFRKKRKNNNLSMFGLRLHIGLFEVEEGIEFYKKYYKNTNEEVKLYVLVSILFEYNLVSNIEKELEIAIKRGIKLRSKLVDLLEKIKDTGKLSKYL